MQTTASDPAGAPENGQRKLAFSYKESAVETSIREFITRNLIFSENGYPYQDEDSFLQHGVIDSLGVLELVTFAGREFGVQVEPAEVTPENFDSVSRLAAFIRRKKNFTTEGTRVDS